MPPAEPRDPARRTSGDPKAVEIRVLILEDTVGDADLIIRTLKRAAFDPKWQRVDNEADFAIRLSPDLDLILSDFTLPQFDGLRALRMVRSLGLDVPFILISGSIGEETAVEAMREGADDYLLKDRMARLGPAVRQALEQRRLRAGKDVAEAALRESEAKFRELIEQASDGIFVADPAGNMRLVNTRYCEMLGYGADELLRLNIADTCPESESASSPGGLAPLAAGRNRVFERTLRRKDGSSFPAELSVKCLQTGLYQGIVRDITERRQQQEKIARLNRIHAVLSSINSAIVRIRDRQSLLDEACRIAVDHGGFGIAWFGMLDAETLDITPAAWAGFKAEEYLAGSKSSARADHPSGQGVAGRAVREGTTIVSNDLMLEEGPPGKRRSEAIRRGYRSRIALPLRMSDSVIGALVLFAKEKDFFNEDELKLLRELADNVSFALDHIASEQKIEKLSRIRVVSGEINAAIVRSRSRRDLLDEACRIAVEHGGFGIAWIGMLDPDSLEIIPAACAGVGSESFLAHSRNTARADGALGGGIAGRAIREQRAVYSNDLQAEPTQGGERRKEALRRGYRSVITLPLLAEGTAVGNLSLFAKEANFFNEEEVDLLTQLAGNISFALESIARQAKIERLSRVRSVLGGINAAIVRAHAKQELFDEACRIAVDAGGFAFAWLGLVDRDAARIRPVAHAGAATGFLEEIGNGPSLDASAPHGPGLSARAVLEMKPVIVNDTQSDLRIGRREIHKTRSINSVAILPLIVANEAAGILALHAREAGFFDEEEVKVLSELAGDIAFALQTIEKQEKLDYLSYYDTLTGLPNRALFIDRTGQQLRARGGETPVVAVILINLERFRNINETFGRRGGDELLKQVAQRLDEAFRGKDYLARTAADGFGVVVRGMRDAALVAHVVESQILECFRRPFILEEAEVRVAAKAGIAMFPHDGADADTLFKNAEAALKKAHDSADRYLFYAADMTARAAQVLALETRLRKAVEAQQFVLHYQPKIALSTGEICGLEALIRWQEPGGALVAPGVFIPVLEETGLILEVGTWVLARALADYREWSARGLNVPRIAANVSAIQLQQRDFADLVIETVHQAGVSAEALELEVTESLLMKDVEASIRKLSILRATGIHIAMDDFGTGYSSLSYIARLPINSVKIDRSFVSGMGANDQDPAIVTTIVTLAHSLKLRVVAEGVETPTQSRLLKLLECDEAQGFLFSKPLPAAEIEPLLHAPAESPKHQRTAPGAPSRPAPPSPGARTTVRRVPKRAPKGGMH